MMHVVTSDETRSQAGDSSNRLMWVLGVDVFAPSPVSRLKLVGHLKQDKLIQLEIGVMGYGMNESQ